jgi:lipase chaperone LimK
MPLSALQVSQRGARQRQVRFGLLIAALSLLGWLVWRGDLPQRVSAPVPLSGATWWGSEVEDKGGIATPLLTGLEGLPPSLAGTLVDGAVSADAAGHLRLDRGVRNLFDYFLTLVGEEPLPRVRARLLAYLQQRLPLKAAGEAQALLDRYLAYQAASGQAGSADPRGSQDLSAQAVAQRHAVLKSLRQQYFSALEYQAFFGDEEAQDRYAIERLAVMQDDSLGAVEKAQRMRDLINTLPRDLQDHLSVMDRYQDLQAITSQWRASGGDAQALRVARVQMVGADAADRLEVLDKQREQWAARVQAYQAQQGRIMDDNSLSQSQREQALSQLMSSSFNAQERLRVTSLAPVAAKP